MNPTPDYPRTARAAVLRAVGGPLLLEDFEIPRPLPPGSILCRVRISTICGSDLHTFYGRRQEPLPLILGHEIVGEIAAFADGAPEVDSLGRSLAVGDRVTWSIMASCGTCFFCCNDLPQKCTSLIKYGHRCCSQEPALSGGFAEYVVLLPGTTIIKPDAALPDEVVVPVNCAFATTMFGMSRIDIQPGENVLIQGAGLLGINMIALCREAGVGTIFVADISQDRLKTAERFGADVVFEVARNDPEATHVVDGIRKATSGRGVDAVVEICGKGSVGKWGFGSLRTGGRYLFAGTVSPENWIELDGNVLTRGCFTIHGIHNYRPVDLEESVCFLERHWKKYPFEAIVSETYSLSDINAAFEAAGDNRHIRIAVKPEA